MRAIHLVLPAIVALGCGSSAGQRPSPADGGTLPGDDGSPYGWKVRYSGTSGETVHRLRWTGQSFEAIGSGSMSSTDGLTWTTRPFTFLLDDVVVTADARVEVGAAIQV